MKEIRKAYAQGVKEIYSTDSIPNSAETVKRASEKGTMKQGRTAGKYSYESLVSKPDMKVTLIDDTIRYQPDKQTRKEVVDQALKNAAKIGYTNESGNVFVRVEDIDTDVMLSKGGLRHGLDRRFSILAPVTVDCGKILRNAVRVNELTPENETIGQSYILVGVAKNKKNEAYIVSFVVNRATNEVTSVDVLYSVNTKKEPTGLIDPGVPAKADHLTGSTISISNLLDFVNRYFPDVLSEDVLRHYGHKFRPEGRLGESALYQSRTPYQSARDILVFYGENEGI